MKEFKEEEITGDTSKGCGTDAFSWTTVHKNITDRSILASSLSKNLKLEDDVEQTLVDR